MTSNSGRFVTDTHALVWHLARSRRLSPGARELMQRVDNGEAELVVPTIVLAEALHISERRDPGVTFEQILSYVSAMPLGSIVTLNLPVILETRSLPMSMEMHDRIIAATARVYGATLISRDPQMGAVVDVIW